jgi:hypothetical protein
MRRSLLLATVTFLIGTLLGMSRPGSVSTQAQAVAAAHPLLPQPSGWVPFTADVKVTEPGKPDITGTFARASDGSDRLDVTNVGSKARIVTIHNVTQNTYYQFSKAGWVSGPMGVSSPNMYQPAKWRANMVGLAGYGHTLALKQGQDGNIRSTDSNGFTAISYTTPSGHVRLMVADLNYFPVVRQSMGGRLEVYSNIVIGEPDSNLFVPPAGVPIRQTGTVKGIVRGLPPAPQQKAQAQQRKQ